MNQAFGTHTTAVDIGQLHHQSLNHQSLNHQSLNHQSHSNSRAMRHGLYRSIIGGLLGLSLIGAAAKKRSG